MGEAYLCVAFAGPASVKLHMLRVCPIGQKCGWYRGVGNTSSRVALLAA